MKFLTILIIAFFHKNWVGGNPFRSILPFDRYQSLFAGRSLGKDSRYLLAVAIPLVILWLVYLVVGDWLAGLPWLLVSVVVMVYAVQPRDTGVAFEEQPGWLKAPHEEAASDDLARKQNDFRARTVYEAFTALHPTVFWFLALGPAGALIYVVSSQYLDGLVDCDEEDEEAPGVVEQVVFWMEWIAARVTGLIFALLGTFGKCFSRWLAIFADTETPVADTLDDLAKCALNTPDYGDDFARIAGTEVEELHKLLDRTVWGWVGLAAIVALLNW